jgi:uncharacterized oxidoreductase
LTGKGLAEALHRAGNKVIISGRRQGHLDATTRANPGMSSLVMDAMDTRSVADVAATLLTEYLTLNVLINNAGIMLPDDAASTIDEELLISTVTTNLLAPIRLTSALIEHLKRQDKSTIVNVSSVLGYVPMATTAVYSATKAALHSYSMSLRYQLKRSSVSVQEIAPPWVRTDLMNSKNEERAMPLNEFIGAIMLALESDSEEILVEQARMMRANPGVGEHKFVNEFNDLIAEYTQ